MDAGDTHLVVDLAQAVADGSDVDWGHAETGAVDPLERRVVQQLHNLARLAQAGRSQSWIWGTLEVRGEIGRGTFGAVYRAWDPRLEREVALKLLHPAQTDEPVDWAAISEGRLLARVRHSNVVAVYGADAFDARIGICMEFVEGRTLKEIVEAQGPFGAQEAALIGRDVCRALAAVHRQGFLHRDVKAQNVMREAGGRTVLMDFGAGQATAGHAPSVLRGTPVYLAPELLEGAPPCVQSDLYGVGVLLFFLVTGTFPVTGASLAEFRRQHAEGVRRRLRDARPDLPAAFVRVIEACTAADPKDRPDSAGTLESLLDAGLVLPNGVLEKQTTASPGGQPARSRSSRAATYALVAAAMTTALVAVPIVALRWSRYPPPNSVAILPFENLSTDAASESFSRDVSSQIAARLTALGTVRVMSGAAVGRYAGTGKSGAEIGAELGAAAAMGGSISRSGGEVRIESQLMDARTGEPLWSDTFVRELQNVVNVQLDVSQAIAVAVNAELSLNESEALGRRRPKDWETFALYQSGRYYSRKRLEEHLRTSLKYFQRALEHDPSYAPAYAGIADSYSLLGVSAMMAVGEALSRATAAATRAIELDPRLAEAHASLGYIHKQRFEWDLAEKSLRRAIELKPGYAQAHHWYSIYLSQHGRFPEAIEEAKTAISLDPQAVPTNAQLGTVLSLYRRYDDCVAQFERVLTLDPHYTAAYQIIGECDTYSGRYDRAFASLDMAMKVAPVGLDNQELLADRAQLLARAGRQREATTVLRQLIDRERLNPRGIAGHIATTYAALGDKEHAFEWLAVAMERRDRQMGYLKVDPRWDPLRGDRRFQPFLAQAGFSTESSAHE